MARKGPDYCDWKKLAHDTGVSIAVARHLVRQYRVEVIAVRERVISISKADFLDKCAHELPPPASAGWIPTRAATDLTGLSASELHHIAPRQGIQKKVSRGVAYWCKANLEAYLVSRDPPKHGARKGENSIPAGWISRSNAARVSGLSERWLDMLAHKLPDAVIKIGHRKYWKASALPKRKLPTSPGSRARVAPDSMLIKCPHLEPVNQ